MTIQPQFIILPIVCAILGISGAVLLITYYKIRRIDFAEYHTHTLLGVGAWILSAIAACFIIGTLIMFIPFNAKYLTYNHEAGTLLTNTNQFKQGTGSLSLQSDGDGTSTDYVVRLRENGVTTVYNVQDDRILAFKEGQRVNLTCTVQWVYQGQDQNNCFVRSY